MSRSSRLLPLVLLALFTFLPRLSSAQGAAFELTPYYGYQSGGSFNSTDRDFGRLEFDIDDSSVYGASFGIPVGAHFQIELLYFRQSSSLELNEGTFVPGTSLGDVDLDVYHVGMLWQSIAGQVRPYAVMSGGLTKVDPRLGGSETEFSLSFGGGVKVLFNEHLGVRLDGRFFFTNLGDDYPYYGGCCYYDSGSALVQAQFAGGLILRF